MTDVIGATVGIEREGLRAICPGSRFGWKEVSEKRKSGKFSYITRMVSNTVLLNNLQIL